MGVMMQTERKLNMSDFTELYERLGKENLIKETVFSVKDIVEIHDS